MILVLQRGRLKGGRGGRDTQDCPSDHRETQEQTPDLPVWTPSPPHLCWYKAVKPRNDEAEGALLPYGNEGASQVVLSRC